MTAKAESDVEKKIQSGLGVLERDESKLHDIYAKVFTAGTNCFQQTSYLLLRSTVASRFHLYFGIS